MKKNEIRRKKLKELIDLRAGGSIANFSQLIDKNPAYVACMLYPEGKPWGRRIGEKMAEHICTELHLPQGWLDVDEDNINDAKTAFNHNAISALDISASKLNGAIRSSDICEVISVIQYTEEHYFSMFGKTNPNKLKIINIKGDSMSNTLEPGDLIFVDISVSQFDGDGIYVFYFSGYLSVKRLQKTGSIMLVHSDNPQYKDWEITEGEEKNLVILGKVLTKQSQNTQRFA